MGVSLFSLGKRKCHLCKKIKKLSVFPKRSAKYLGYRAYKEACKSCGPVSRLRYDFRTRFIASRGNRCEKCGLHNPHKSFFDLDHIDRSKKVHKHRSALASEKDNLQVLCPNCHRLKGIKHGDIGRSKKLRA